MAFPAFEFPKDPSEKLDYSFDFAPLIGDASIETQSVTCTLEGLTITNVTLTGAIVSAFIAGGLVGKKYPIAFGVQLLDGRNFERTMTLPVAQR